MGIHKLSDLKIQAAISSTRKLAALGLSKNQLLGDGGCLYVQVSKSGSASFLFRYMRSGKPLSVGLGGYPAVSLKGAREKAQEQRELLACGSDPVAVKRQQGHERVHERQLEQGGGLTFEVLARRFIEVKSPEWKSQKHAQQWTNTLATYAFPVIGSRPVAQIYVEDIQRILEPIWLNKNETARRVLGRVSSVLDYATVLKFRQGDNPARYTGNVEYILPKRIAGGEVQHHASMPYTEVPAFLKALERQEGMARWALEFTILTACRTSEVLKATWDEFDLDRGVWTIPQVRMKAGREHRVPLSARALEVLAVVRPFSSRSYVFPGNRSKKRVEPGQQLESRPLSSMAMAMLLRRMKVVDCTVHGFRSSFRSWAGELTEYDFYVVENALAHQLKDRVAAAYLRTDYWGKRRGLMADWAAFCGFPVTGG